MRPCLFLSLCALFSFRVHAQRPSSAQPNAPCKVGISLDHLDKAADPCSDFYQYACGNWMKTNPVPADQARWGRFTELAERNRDTLHRILEEASAPNPKRGEIERKYGDYYATCIDARAIDAKGLAPLKPELDRIAAIEDRTGLLKAVARVHQISERGATRIPQVVERTLFMFGSNQDLHDATRMVANVDQAGIGLPDRDYYLNDDDKSKELRKGYLGHVAKMLQLSGEPQKTAEKDAQTVMALETRLAKASMDRVARRDPTNHDHPMKVAELLKVAPGFDFQAYFAAVGAPPFDSLNVGNPEFFKQVSDALSNLPIADWKVYLRWQLVHALATVLPTPFGDEDFHFYGQILKGQKEQQARWKRCVIAIDNELGEALGQPYVQETFGPQNKDRTRKMVNFLEAALEQDIGSLPWMTEVTKKRAVEKLHAIINKIGYPDVWRDYSTLRIARGDAIGNSMRAREFEVKRNLAKIGQPADRSEWRMTPPTVNAYYSGAENSINFPAGILQPPFYDGKMDDAVNFGGIGAVIGHELTHGFDDQGRKFDAAGNLENWWTPEDAKAFEQRATCIADEYSGFVAVKNPDLKVNGRLTLGENTADNGGLRIAHIALESSLAGKEKKSVDGFTPEQRVFLAWGQIWCENSREDATRLQVQTNAHSPGRFRVNGVVQNMPEFKAAFSCKVGQPLAPPTSCRVW